MDRKGTTWIHAPLERFNINQQRRRDIFPPTPSRFCCLSALFRGWFPKSSHRDKSKEGMCYLVAVHCFCPTASPRYREVWTNATVITIWTKLIQLNSWHNMCAIQLCPKILLQNQIREATSVSIWLTIFGSSIGRLVHNNEGLLFQEKLLSGSYIFDSSQCGQ